MLEEGDDSVSRRTARRLAALLVLAALAPRRCGDDRAATTARRRGLSAVTVSGEFGEEPEVTWDGQFDRASTRPRWSSRATAPRSRTGDSVRAPLDRQRLHRQEGLLSTSARTPSPSCSPSARTLIAGSREAIDGQTIGSRVAVAAPAEGRVRRAGQPPARHRQRRHVVFVVDLISTPSSTARAAPSRTRAAWAPARRGATATPTGLDFTGTPKPATSSRSPP